MVSLYSSKKNKSEKSGDSFIYNHFLTNKPLITYPRYVPKFTAFHNYFKKSPKKKSESYNMTHILVFGVTQAIDFTGIKFIIISYAGANI